MNTAKKLFIQAMTISSSILFLNGLNAVIQHFRGNDIILQWYHPISIVLVGICCALPTALLKDHEQWGRPKLLAGIVLHCVTLYAVVALSGRLFHWYSNAEELAGVSFVFFTVYIFVWLSSHWLDKQDAKKINLALDSIRDEE